MKNADAGPAAHLLLIWSRVGPGHVHFHKPGGDSGVSPHEEPLPESAAHPEFPGRNPETEQGHHSELLATVCPLPPTFPPRRKASEPKHGHAFLGLVPHHNCAQKLCS